MPSTSWINCWLASSPRLQQATRSSAERLYSSSRKGPYELRTYCLVCRCRHSCVQPLRVFGVWTVPRHGRLLPCIPRGLSTQRNNHELFPDRDGGHVHRDIGLGGDLCKGL